MQKTITHANFAKGFRGGERQTLLLIEELSRRGYTQEIFTRVDSDLANRLLDVKNLTIKRVKKPYIFYGHLVDKNSILHAHETKAAQFAYLVNLIYKVPYIVTRRVDNKIKKNFFTRSIYKNSASTVVLSSAIKQRVQEVSESINIKVIPSAYTNQPIDENFVKSIKTEYKGKFLLGNIAALDIAKGHIYLIEAMKKLQNTHPDIHLLFVGSGKDEELIKKQTYGVKNISFVGFVNNIADYIKTLDLFVFPTLNEGLGSILLDVMINDIPVIATNIGGIPDIVKDKENGLLIRAKNTQDIYQAIVKLYEDRSLADRLAKNAKSMIKDFSVDSMTSRYEKLYEEIS